MRMNTALGMMLAIALVGGCGKKNEGKAGADKAEDKKAEDPDLAKKTPGSCDHRGDTGICTFNKEFDAEMCKAMSGKAIAGECPKEDAVPGTCLCKTEYNTEIKTYYTTSSAKYTAETAAEACKNQQCEWQPAH
jgi:hypothetical protein